MPNPPPLVDAAGRPLARPAPSAMAAYTAADRRAPALTDYHPSVGSADSDLLPERGDLVAGARDHARNDGWITGGVQRTVDAVIGSSIRLQSKPDHRELGITIEEAHALGRAIETKWKGFANHPGRWADAARRTNVAGVFARAFRHWVVDGEALGVVQWRPGRSRYATCLQVVDPDRLSNPHEGPDTEALRGGVHIDPDGAAIGYHLRRAHPGDALFAGVGLDAWTWDHLPRETDWGRPIVIHHYQVERAGQTRGKPPLAPVIDKLRMLTRASNLEMKTFIRDALMQAFITSPYDPELVESRMGDQLGDYQNQRLEFHSRARISLDGVRVPVLFPGEEPHLLAPTRPSSGFPAFVQTFLRLVASSLGLSYEQLSQDWSGVNYSSARAALLEVWRSFTARRDEFVAGFILPFFGAWLEEALDLGDIEPPAGCAAFWEAPAAWLNSTWLGPPKGYVDPEKEAKAAVLRLQAGLSTLESECADQGRDYEEVLHQRKREADLMAELGLPNPSWAEVAAVVGAVTSPTPPGSTDAARA